jgi:hypothetical protein
MVLPKETIARGADNQCSDCGDIPELQICRSPAGYYIGTYCQCGPYSRESNYYETRQGAEAALKAGGYER